jgi:hypothetical protein
MILTTQGFLSLTTNLCLDPLPPVMGNVSDPDLDWISESGSGSRQAKIVPKKGTNEEISCL